MVLDIISGGCLLLGGFLAISSGLGIIRFPDFYTRMHAVGVSDTLVTFLILVGLMLQMPEWLVLAKLIFILLMTLFINPSASHALAKAALKNGLMPKIANKTDKREQS